MGLIKALTSSVSSGLGDQFKEFVDCPQVENNVIIARGIVNHGVGNSNAQDGIISNGSAIAVPQGMAMMIVDNGKIVEFSAEPGTFTWDTSSEPSIFAGSLGKSLLDSIKTIGSRITFGGQTAKDQRVYYVNIKTIPSLTFGSTSPKAIYDPGYGITINMMYNGMYSIKIDDPVILINEVVGANPKDILTFDDIFSGEGGNMLKQAFSQRVAQAISDIMTKNNISFNMIQSYTTDVTDKMNDLLDSAWHEKYGIIVTDVSIDINPNDESRTAIAEIEKTKSMGQVYSSNIQGTMAAAAAEAMKSAANNDNGAMMGFMGMGMAQAQTANIMSGFQGAAQAPSNPAPGPMNFGGAMASQPAPQVAPVQEAPVEAPVATESASAPVEAPAAKICPTCGAEVAGKFCSECGTKVE